MRTHGKVTAEHLRALSRVHDGLTRSLSEAEAFELADEGPMLDEHDDRFDDWADNHPLARIEAWENAGEPE